GARPHGTHATLQASVSPGAGLLSSPYLIERGDLSSRSSQATYFVRTHAGFRRGRPPAAGHLGGPTPTDRSVVPTCLQPPPTLRSARTRPRAPLPSWASPRPWPRRWPPAASPRPAPSRPTPCP